MFEIFLFWLVIDVPYLLYRFILFFHRKIKSHKKEHHHVSILVPAYNEEISIEKTLESCVYQSYPSFEIIVINDGSTDGTKEKVESFMIVHADYCRKRKISFHLINQKNTGKAKAMNAGMLASRGDFLVTIDADSYLHKHALENLMKYFEDSAVGAVAGNVVGLSSHSLLGYIQKVEYELGLYMIRESQSTLGDVLVTPGALSGYRKSALKKFQEGTLTEDFDTSVKELEDGYMIIVAKDAVCYTQVPLTITDLIKQRIRWQRGGLEVFAKHLFHKKRFSVWIEWFLTFIFGFYGLFAKLISVIIIPLLFMNGGLPVVISTLLLFFAYTSCIFFLQFVAVHHHTRDRKLFFLIPLFVLYYYSIILYAILIAQIIIFREKEQRWEKLKRYHI